MRDAARHDPADPGPNDPTRAALDRRRRRDAAAALTAAGLALFATPLIDLAAGAGPLLGLPAALLYIFAAWFALIAVTARLARRLLDQGPP